MPYFCGPLGLFSGRNFLLGLYSWRRKINSLSNLFFRLQLVRQSTTAQSMSSRASGTKAASGPSTRGRWRPFWEMSRLRRPTSAATKSSNGCSLLRAATEVRSASPGRCLPVGRLVQAQNYNYSLLLPSGPHLGWPTVALTCSLTESCLGKVGRNSASNGVISFHALMLDLVF